MYFYCELSLRGLFLLSKFKVNEDSNHNNQKVTIRTIIMKLVKTTRSQKQQAQQQTQQQAVTQRSSSWRKLLQGVCSVAVFSLCAGVTSATVVFANDKLTERPAMVLNQGGHFGDTIEQPDAGVQDDSVLDQLALTEFLQVADPKANGASVQQQEHQPNNQAFQQKVNINLANFEQLVALPGIGKVKANAILDYRKQEGAFNSVADIQNIKGIGSKLFAKLNHLIEI